MKKRKKIVSRLLCAALITATLPIGTPTAYAAEEPAEPSRTAYADKKGLQENYDLRADTAETVKSVQRVFFGKDGNGNQQKWKIVGKDTQIGGENIVLFADSAIKTPGGKADGTIQFWPDKSATTKTYPTGNELAELGIITYVNGNTPGTVNVNHYGTSPLRSELRKMTDKKVDNGVTTYNDTNYFTVAQQKLMNETTITTEDTYIDPDTGKNGNYTTTDILYAAYGDSDDTDDKDQYIHVGTNRETDDLNNGMKIDGVINGVNIWGKENKIFWLRAPDPYKGRLALVAYPGGYVRSYSGDPVDSHAVVPAFDLNLTSVIFASAAPAASSQIKAAKITETDDAMTFRWADETGEKARIKSTATWNEDGVGVINKDGNKEVYLCVQGNNGGQDWIWSQKVSDVTSPISDDSIADDIKAPTSLADPKVELSKCKIWLETTDTNEDLTYAKEVKEGNFVSITAGTNSGLEITSGNAAQTVNKDEKISDIAFNVKNTHYLENTDDFIKTINDKLNPSGNPSGLTAKQATAGTGFTISGTPTRDVTIQLPAATAKQTPETPTLSADNITRTKNSLSIKTDGFNTTTYGPIQYRYKQASASDWAVDWTEGTEISGLQAGTAYTIAIRYKGAGIYLPSEPSELTISTLEDTGNTDTDSNGQDGSNPDTDNDITGGGKNQSNTVGPRTGDNNSPALWLVLMLVSLAGVAAAFYGRRKRVR